jgi:signal transduction histidine kinase
LDVIRTETERLSALINDMLDVSKIEAGKLELRPEKFDLVDLLKGCPLYHQAKEKGLGIVFDFPKKKLIIYADRDRIQQVLINLVSNAIKFTDEGKITVGFDLMRNKKVRVYVKDTGLGIGEQDMKHIFEKFYQSQSHLRRSVGGSGLGLNISKQIIEMHKGKMSVTSKLEKGSEFSFVIPIMYKEAQKEGEGFATSIIDKYY